MRLGRRHETITADPNSCNWSMAEAQKVFRRLPAVLESLGISPSTLAKSIGVHRRSIYRWFDNCSAINFHHALRLASILEARARYLTKSHEEFEFVDVGLTEEELKIGTETESETT